MPGPYDDIIDLERPVSRRHPPMPMEERAAQFSPFAALTGYERIIREASRRTASFTEPDEDRKQEINRTLQQLFSGDREHPPARITYFVPDGLLPGGEYVTELVTLRRIDPAYRLLELSDHTCIPLDNITEVTVP